MKHGKQRAIRKIACRFKNQQNRLLKSLVIANWFVSGAKATCASCILQDSRTSVFKAEGLRIQEDSRENMSIKKDGLLSSEAFLEENILQFTGLLTVIPLDYIRLGPNQRLSCFFLRSIGDMYQDWLPGHYSRKKKLFRNR